MSPLYPIPWNLVFKIFAASLRNQQRPFHQDARLAVSSLQPALEVLGQQNIPASGGYLITSNHYSSPGFGAWWLTLSVNSLLARDVHWIMTGAMVYPGKWFETPVRLLSSWAFRRVAQVYGFSNMPPIPPYSDDVAGRARAVRRILEYARRTPNPLIGMAPEGTDHPGGVLGPTPGGLGRFIAHLAPLCQLIMPVGIYDTPGHLCVHFGAPYRLQVPVGLSANQTDQHVSQVVMRAIARLLPTQLRGQYG